MKLLIVALAFTVVVSDPLACQPNAEQPMLPIFHLIGNVTKHSDGTITLEDINDCSGITYYGGLYHIWHQCCQNHFDHVISKDLVHWQRLPPPIAPWTGKGGFKTWDGSVTILPKADGGPIILYDAQDGKLDDGLSREEYLNKLHGPRDSPILGVARLVDLDDKYLQHFSRRSNPVIFDGKPASFPGQIWKNGDHWNMVMQGTRYQSTNNSFHNWKNMDNGGVQFVGHGENGGQWWMDVPNQVDGSPPPAGVSNRIVNIGGGDHYLFGNYDAAKETFTPWDDQPTPPPSPPPPPTPAPKYARMMNDTNLMGGDFYVGCANNTCTTPVLCQAACDAAAKCKSWTLVVKQKCCLKGNVPRISHAKGMFSGVKDPNAPTPAPAPPAPHGKGKEGHLEGGKAGWWGAQMTHDPAGEVKDRAFMVGWALGDYHGPAGPGINVLTRLTGLREINFDAKTMNLIANPIPELKTLRTGSLASEKAVGLTPGAIHSVKGTEGGAASSADVELTFSGAAVLTGGTFGACVLSSSGNDGLGITITVTNTSTGRMANVNVGACAGTETGMEVEAQDGVQVTGGPSVPLFDDQTVSVRITPDRSLADFFVQGGRWAGTLAWLSKAPRKSGDSAVLVWSKTAGVAVDVDVYGMGCGWLNPSYTEHPTI
jgi:hypothetical protein